MRKDSGFEMMKRNSEFQENNLYLSSSYGKIESVPVENQFSGGYEGYENSNVQTAQGNFFAACLILHEKIQC